MAARTVGGRLLAASAVVAVCSLSDYNESNVSAFNFSLKLISRFGFLQY